MALLVRENKWKPKDPRFASPPAWAVFKKLSISFWVLFDKMIDSHLGGVHLIRLTSSRVKFCPNMASKKLSASFFLSWGPSCQSVDQGDCRPVGKVDEFDTDRLKSIPERLGRFLFLLSPPFFSIPFEIRKRKIRSLMILKHRSFSLQRKGGLIP